MMTYNDFFEIDPGYKPVMTAEEINREPEIWLNYFPHNTFVDILRTLIEKLENGDRSLWMYGAYGTGKTHAALVIQKLFYDDESRLEKYFNKYSKQIDNDLCKSIRKWRTKKVFPIFEYGTENITNTERFLIRIEKAIVRDCKNNNLIIPVRGSIDELVHRIKMEGDTFFAVRDSIISQLEHLTCDIKTFADFEKAIANETYSDGVLQDAVTVLQKHHVYLAPSAEGLLDWVEQICKVNNISKIVFLWDEFTAYINNCKSDLKAFEKMAEAKAQICGFHFVPITHSHINAYFATGSDSAKKATDRYAQKPLSIPENIIFSLGHDALNVKPARANEWQREVDRLSSAVQLVVTQHMLPHLPELSMNDFKGVLPIHPMAAFLLSKLSQEEANVRSFFDYLKKDSSSNPSEFQQFIAVGGPDVDNKQYLTVDYLWNYFVMGSEIGTSNHVLEARNHFETKTKNAQLNEIEQRVFKAVLLYWLINKNAGSINNELLLPKIENIVRAFEGDGSIVNVRAILENLSERQCFAIVADSCEVFSTGSSIDVAPEMKKLRDEFTRLIATKSADKLKNIIDDCAQDKLRYDVKAYDGSKIKHSDIVTKDRYGAGQPPGGNQILINFLLAKNPQDQLEIPEKIRHIAKQFSNLRIIFATFPDLTFCDDDESNWEKYIENQARANIATDSTMKSYYEENNKKIFARWEAKLREAHRTIRFYSTSENGEVYEIDAANSTRSIRQELEKYLKIFFPKNVDEFSMYFSGALKVPATSLKAWAQAGLQPPSSGQYYALVKNFQQSNIAMSMDWFDKKPEHQFSVMRNRALEYLKNAIYKGGAAVSFLYREFRRHPYGLEQNGYSAFVLGFILRDWIDPDNNYQYTDGNNTYPLTAEVLAKIIEDVIKNDDSGKINNELLICRLSKEERGFVAGMAKMFQLQIDKDATPETACNTLTGQLLQRTGNVPLWMLPVYIKDETGEANVSVIEDTIYTLCTILGCSGRRAELRTENVKKLGAILNENPDLPEQLNHYFSADKFASAFRYYFEKNIPALRETALKINDTWNNYCEEIKNRFVQEASWLWNETNVIDVANEILSQYKIIETIQNISGVKTFVSFSDAMTMLRQHMIERNKISLQSIGLSYPAISRIQELVQDSKLSKDALEELANLLSQQSELMKNLFFDSSMNLQIEFFRKLFTDSLGERSEQEWKELYQHISNGTHFSHADFKKNTWSDIERYLEGSLQNQLRAIWTEQTGSGSLQDWNMTRAYPAELLFRDNSIAQQIIPVIENPANFQKERIENAVELLRKNVIGNPSNEELNKELLLRFLPKKYAKLNVDAIEFKKYLALKLGNDAHRWHSMSNLPEVVTEFITKSYSAVFKTKAVEKVKKLSDQDAKRILLALVDSSPEVGLEILE